MVGEKFFAGLSAGALTGVAPRTRSPHLLGLHIGYTAPALRFLAAVSHWGVPKILLALSEPPTLIAASATPRPPPPLVFLPVVAPAGPHGGGRAFHPGRRLTAKVQQAASRRNMPHSMRLQTDRPAVWAF